MSRCEVVNGALVHGDRPLTDEARTALSAVIAAARTRLAEMFCQTCPHQRQQGVCGPRLSPGRAGWCPCRGGDATR